MTPKTPVPADPSNVEQAFAEQLKGRLFADKSWVRKYLDGDREAATQIALVNVILSSKVAS